ncbi:MAG: hypothetical protein WCH60_18890 [Burkholderiales bacterium]
MTYLLVELLVKKIAAEQNKPSPRVVSEYLFPARAIKRVPLVQKRPEDLGTDRKYTHGAKYETGLIRLCRSPRIDAAD